MMKIFLSFLQSKENYPIADYRFWYNYMSNAINESEFELVENNDLDWARGLYLQAGSEFNIWKEKIWTETVAFIFKTKPQIFISYLYPNMIDVAAIKAIQDLGVPCINFYCDNVRHFKSVPNEFKCFDLNWVPEYDALEMYKSNSVNFIHLPMPMWVPTNLRGESLEKTTDISFIGSFDKARDTFILNLKREFGVDLKIYGAERKFIQENISFKFKSLLRQIDYIRERGLVAFMNKINNRYFKFNYYLGENDFDEFYELYQGKLSSEEYLNVTRESMVTIGINRYYDESTAISQILKYSKLRDIEAPMLGACYLTEKTNGIEKLYDIENEILVYSSGAEFHEQLLRLQNDKQLRTKLRRKGAARSLNDHNIIKSINSIVAEIGI